MNVAVERQCKGAAGGSAGDLLDLTLPHSVVRRGDVEQLHFSGAPCTRGSTYRLNFIDHITRRADLCTSAAKGHCAYFTR